MTPAIDDNNFITSELVIDNTVLLWDIPIIPVGVTQYSRSKLVTNNYTNWTSSTINTRISVGKPTIINPVVTAPLTIKTRGFYSRNINDNHISTDWEISNTDRFTNILLSSYSDINSLLTYTPSGLSSDVVYFVRARHIGSITGYSNWSDSVSFIMPSSYIQNPIILSPVNEGLINNLSVTIQTNSFIAIGNSDIHHSTTWQLSTNSSFNNIYVQSVDDITNLTTWLVTNLIPNTRYYFRLRYKGYVLGYSGWSPILEFNTGRTNNPVISQPVNNSNNVSTTVLFITGLFSITGNLSIHVATTWQLATDSEFANIVNQSTDDIDNKTSWTVDNLLPNKEYYVRAKHLGSVYGYSDWSVVNRFVTKDIKTDTPNITLPVNNSTGVTIDTTFISSLFHTSVVGDRHISSSWQLSSVSDFSSVIVDSINDKIHLTTWNVFNLLPGITYYCRVKYHALLSSDSEYSSYCVFTTDGSLAQIRIETPNIIYPENNAINISIIPTLLSSPFTVI